MDQYLDARCEIRNTFEDMLYASERIKGRPFTWNEAASGNMSAVISCDMRETDVKPLGKLPSTRTYYRIRKQCFLVTASGSRLYELGQNPKKNMGIIRVSDGGESIDWYWGFEGGRPTSELPSHLEIYERRNRKPAGAVAHFHTPFLNALSAGVDIQDAHRLDALLSHLHTESNLYLADGLGFTRAEMPGSQELAKSTLDQLESHDVVLWSHHGVVSVGDSDNPSPIKHAVDRIEVAENLALIFCVSGVMGGPYKLPPYISAKIGEIVEAADLRRMMERARTQHET